MRCGNYRTAVGDRPYCLLDALVEESRRNYRDQLGSLSKPRRRLAVETASILHADFGVDAKAVLSLDGAPPEQFRDIEYAPAEAADEMLDGHGLARPPLDWSDDLRRAHFREKLPHLAHLWTEDSCGLVELASAFQRTLKGSGVPLKLPHTELVCVRAGERGTVRMLDDSGAHLEGWALRDILNVTMVDVPSSHLRVLSENVGLVAGLVKGML